MSEVAERPLRQRAAGAKVFTVVSAVLLTGVCAFAGVFAGVWTNISERFGGAGPAHFLPGGTLVFVAILIVFSALPIAFIVLGVNVSRTSKARVDRLRRARLHRFPAYVTGERTLVTGGAGESPSVTTYHASLQFEDGSREEFPVDGRIAGAIDAGDVGVAYLKGGYLIDFVRIDV